MRKYLEGGYEVYSNLETMNGIYSDIRELENAYWNDSLTDFSVQDDDLEYELNEALADANCLMFMVVLKYDGYKTILEYAKIHPGLKDECLEFYFPDGDYSI